MLGQCTVSVTVHDAVWDSSVFVKYHGVHCKYVGKPWAVHKYHQQVDFLIHGIVVWQYSFDLYRTAPFAAPFAAPCCGCWQLLCLLHEAGLIMLARTYVCFGCCHASEAMTYAADPAACPKNAASALFASLLTLVGIAASLQSVLGVHTIMMKAKWTHEYITSWCVVLVTRSAVVLCLFACVQCEPQYETYWDST